MIEFSFDTADAVHYLEKVETRVLDYALRHAMNKALKRAGRIGKNTLKKKYGLAESGSLSGKPSADDLLEQEKISISDIRKMKEGSIFAESDPINLIHFVLGKKTPQKMAGIPMNRRRKIYVSVRKGRSHRLEKTFIARPSSIKGGIQAFSYGTFKGRTGMFKQTLPQASSVWERRDKGEYITKKAQMILETDFYDRVEKQLAKIRKAESGW